MDVSNSTGQTTGYRVVGAGGTAPDPDKLKDGKFVEIDCKWCEVLAEGDLEPWTYVTVKIKKKPFTVQFHRKGKTLCLCDVVKETSSKKVKHQDLLIALMENGKSAAEPRVCRWKKA